MAMLFVTRVSMFHYGLSMNKNPIYIYHVKVNQKGNISWKFDFFYQHFK